jgi:hypothetical protein
VAILQPGKKSGRANPAQPKTLSCFSYFKVYNSWLLQKKNKLETMEIKKIASFNYLNFGHGSHRRDLREPRLMHVSLRVVESQARGVPIVVSFGDLNWQLPVMLASCTQHLDLPVLIDFIDYYSFSNCDSFVTAILKRIELPVCTACSGSSMLG